MADERVTGCATSTVCAHGRFCVRGRSQKLGISEARGDRLVNRAGRLSPRPTRSGGRVDSQRVLLESLERVCGVEGAAALIEAATARAQVALPKERDALIEFVRQQLLRPLADTVGAPAAARFFAAFLGAIDVIPAGQPVSEPRLRARRREVPGPRTLLICHTHTERMRLVRALRRAMCDVRVIERVSDISLLDGPPPAAAVVHAAAPVLVPLLAAIVARWHEVHLVLVARDAAVLAEMPQRLLDAGITRFAICPSGTGAADVVAAVMALGGAPTSPSEALS